MSDAHKLIAHYEVMGKSTLTELARDLLTELDALAASHKALVSALQTVMRMDVKGHQLQDRLQFSDAGRAILEQALSALAQADKVEK